MVSIYKCGKCLWIAWYQQGKIIRQPLKLIDTRENRKLAEQIILEKELELTRKNFARATNNILFSNAVYYFPLYKNLIVEKNSLHWF